ncbi:MAG: recombinase family protein [Planctomycetota bacterium]
MPKIAFYTRISTDEDHQKYSLGAQKERLEAFCQSQYGDDWQLFSTYRDTESGTHLNRPGLKAMLADAEATAFDILLVYRVDRLSRNVKELAQLVDELTKCGVALKSITEPFDTANAAGKMMLQLLGVFAEFEHSTIVERTKMGMAKKAKGGEFVGGRVPYGYRLDPESGLVIIDEEAAVVRKIFGIYVTERLGVHSIVRKLNDAGYRKRSGKKWDHRVLGTMLRNPIYIGKLRWGESVFDARHQSIVSSKVFDKAQRIIQERREDLNGRRWHNNEERLLTGRIRCVKCQGHMIGISTHKKTRKYPYYVCTSRWHTKDCPQDYVRADLLEATVVNDIKTLFRDERFIDRVWEKTNRRLGKQRPDVESEIKAVESQISKARLRIDRYFDAFEQGKLKPELCSEKVEALTAQLQELNDQKRELEEKRKQLELPAIDRKMLCGLIDNFEKVLARGTNPQKKHLIQQLVKKVRVHNKNKVEVWYGVPGDSQVSTPGRMAPRQ